MKEKNICMGCGKKSLKEMEYRIFGLDGEYRDFHSTECLLKYYKLVLKQEKLTSEEKE